MDHQNKFLFKEIPSDFNTFNSSATLIRMLQGLGYRYYWAIENLVDRDLDYKPSIDSRTIRETLEHIYSLTLMIKKAQSNEYNFRPLKNGSKDLSKLKEKTLSNIHITIEILEKTPFNKILENKIIIIHNKKEYYFDYWNIINGPISDAIYHIGQIVSFRRSIGKPINKGVNFLIGKTKIN
tara:strand:- start:5148 stop:5690 length:543 start_codon:yes stop_codon:yes gene_type:complete